ncbi:DNA replication/repair protein RecF [Natranaerobius trueperi]|uniref:DNA replication and repair protein RecF n=1 Tax=Natranaerobius trueperi TaxID=759412 RepID=A0A226BZ39_9FIRM|nr:DNA replication/repair protein RecF [Natranaerobius trueperi]OWZ83469.1 DNA replication/repair protein RecF [Natranaerobius trueperi]
MQLKELYVKNFRNYPGQSLNFNKPIILFFGENAQGKTNLLEAIYYLATGKSHRAHREKELIRWETSGFYLKGELKKENSEYTLEILQRKGHGKELKINGLPQSNLRNFLKSLNVVIFSPEDLMLIKGTPDNRRRFLDQEINQVDYNYDFYLKNYNKALKQRNKLLKTCQNKSMLKYYLPPWDEQIAKYGVKITLRRKKIIHQIKLLSRLIYRKITNQREDLELKYIPSLESILNDNLKEDEFIDYFLQGLSNNLDNDLLKKSTSIGPHRDDIEFYINGNNARNYGSQGQQRSTVLALKMAELEMIKGEKGEYPILLLDDVLSELDRARRKHLLNLTEARVQTFVTGTSRDDFKGDMLKKAQIYKIYEGEAVNEDAGD